MKRANQGQPGPQGLGWDKKKLVTLAGLVAAGLLLWGRLLLQQAPRTAMADPAAGVAAPQAGALGATPRPRPVVPLSLPPSLRRDLFAFRAQAYPRSAKATAELSVVTPAKTAPVEKSPPQPVDVLSETDVIRQASAGLKLQTTIGGQQPRAVINGQVLAPGQAIGGFTLKKILHRQVLLEMNGIEIQLEM